MRNFWKGCANIIFNLRLYWFPAVKVPLAFRLKGSTLRQVAHHTISLSGYVKYASSKRKMGEQSVIPAIIIPAFQQFYLIIFVV